MRRYIHVDENNIILGIQESPEEIKADNLIEVKVDGYDKLMEFLDKKWDSNKKIAIPIEKEIVKEEVLKDEVI